MKVAGLHLLCPLCSSTSVIGGNVDIDLFGPLPLPPPLSVPPHLHPPPVPCPPSSPSPPPHPPQPPCCSSEGHEPKLPLGLPLRHPHGVGGMLGYLHDADGERLISLVDMVSHYLAGGEGENKGSYSTQPALLRTPPGLRLPTVAGIDTDGKGGGRSNRKRKERGGGGGMEVTGNGLVRENERGGWG